MEKFYKKNRRHILGRFIQENKIQIVAEIGVERCFLLQSLLQSCSDFIIEYWAIDPWQANLSSFKTSRVGKEEWKARYLRACKLMILFPQLRIMKTLSLDAAPLFPKEYFDLVFIDADHHYDAVLSDIKAWWPLVRKNGFLTGHDYGSRRIGVKQAVDEYFGEEKILTIGSIWIKEKI